MEAYLNRGIKDVIAVNPTIADILAEYDIGCGPCNVGTCLLKDIVEIHRLPPEKEKELMARIEQALYPDTAPAARSSQAAGDFLGTDSNHSIQGSLT